MFYTFMGLITLLVFQALYLSGEKSMTVQKKEKKILFVKLTGLPDLALSPESSYIRHRSLSFTSDIYPLDGCLREYDKSTYSIANSTIMGVN